MRDGRRNDPRLFDLKIRSALELFARVVHGLDFDLVSAGREGLRRYFRAIGTVGLPFCVGSVTRIRPGVFLLFAVLPSSTRSSKATTGGTVCGAGHQQRLVKFHVEGHQVASS